VKRLIERLGAHTARPRAAADAAHAAALADDTQFDSTQPFDAADEPRRAVSWTERAVEARAEPHDRTLGAKVYAELWGRDPRILALGDDEVQRLTTYLHFVRLPAGQTVIGQDEQGDYMLIVLDGTLSVDRVQPWGGRSRLAEARAGDMLGEMSLLDAGTRFCACTTLSPCVIAVLDARHLDEMIRDEPRLALAMLASVSRRLSLRLRQVSARLSALLSQP
jgi:CRP/FNR family cyclic AMP-dependent transcriptional regulator